MWTTNESPTANTGEPVADIVPDRVDRHVTLWIAQVGEDRRR